MIITIIYIYNQLLHMVSSSSVKSLASLLSRCDEMPAPWPLSRSVLDGAKTQWRNCEYWTLWTFWSWNMSLNRPTTDHLSSVCRSWNQKPVRNKIWTTAWLNSRPQTVQTFPSQSQESAVWSSNASLSWWMKYHTLQVGDNGKTGCDWLSERWQYDTFLLCGRQFLLFIQPKPCSSL